MIRVMVDLGRSRKDAMLLLLVVTADVGVHGERLSSLDSGGVRNDHNLQSRLRLTIPLTVL